MLRFIKTFFAFLLCLLLACAGSKSDSVDPLILSIKKQFAPDGRVALFQVKPACESKKLVLRGETTIPRARQALLDSLEKKKIPVVDSILVLPDISIGDKPWGLITLSVGNMRKKPDHAAEMVSQLLLGTPVKILQFRHGWYRIQSPDEYIGWIDDSALAPVTEASLNKWKKSDRYLYRQTSGYVYADPDDESQVVSDLVLGDLFPVLSGKKGFLQMQFPDGRTGFVRKNDCEAYPEWVDAKPDVDKIIETARHLVGRPYLWGGTSTKAIDCSGLMKTAYYSQGVILARDASQQARYGEVLPVTDSLNFLPGDLLFFGRSKDHVTHVGMYIGKGRYVHSSGLVRINSLNPRDSDYLPANRKRLVSASRVLNSLNTEEVIQVKQHPWYNLRVGNTENGTWNPEMESRKDGH